MIVASRFSKTVRCDLSAAWAVPTNSPGSLSCAVVVLLLCVCQTAQAQDPLEALENAMVNAVATAEPNVVSIARLPASAVSSFDDFLSKDVGPGNPDFVPNDFGSGVVIQTRNPAHKVAILTNYHVVKGGPKYGDGNSSTRSSLFAWIPGSPVSKATIIAADPYSDLALLAIDSRVLNTVPPKGFQLKPTDLLKKGQLVYAFGNPYAAARDGSPSVGLGIVSNIARSRPPNPTASVLERRKTLHHFGTLLQISSRLQLGQSGGALLDRKGRLIGITSAMAAVDGYEQSAGYAIPFTSSMARVIRQLEMGYEVEYGFLGVQTADAAALDLQGLPAAQGNLGAALIRNVLPNSPAEAASLQPGDVVLEVNNARTRHQYDLMREIALNGPFYPKENNVAKLKIWRARRRQTLTVDVKPGKWPVREVGITSAARFPAWQGLTVDHNTARYKYIQTTGAATLHRAVLVTGVDSNVDHQIQQGDFISHVNDRAVTTPAEFHSAVRNARGEAVTLTLVDGRQVKIDR